jgi:hypothetical protein
MIKAGVDTDVYLGSGVRVGTRKRGLEPDSILRVDVAANGQTDPSQ